MANPGVIQSEQSALNFMTELQGQQLQAFSGNQAALNAVQSAWAPVLQTGAVPYGYSPALDSLLKSNIINLGATATTNAMNAAALRQRQATGGAPGAAPQGAQEAITAEIAARGQQATAANLAQEKIAGYDQGLKNLEGATSAELGVSRGEDVTGLAGATTGEGKLGLEAAQAQWQENQASSLSSILGDIGGVAKDITGVGNVVSMFDPNLGKTKS
jgi:hypothetical protein